MEINYWNCKYASADEWSTEDDSDGGWNYWCDHPNSESKYCHLDNKWRGETDDCKLLDGGE